VRIDIADDVSQEASVRLRRVAAARRFALGVALKKLDEVSICEQLAAGHVMK
jgi:hypothetical protein